MFSSTPVRCTFKTIIVWIFSFADQALALRVLPDEVGRRRVARVVRAARRRRREGKHRPYQMMPFKIVAFSVLNILLLPFTSTCTASSSSSSSSSSSGGKKKKKKGGGWFGRRGKKGKGKGKKKGGGGGYGGFGSSSSSSGFHYPKKYGSSSSGYGKHHSSRLVLVCTVASPNFTP